METAYLGIGSNVGQRADNIQAALQAIAASLRVDRISSLFETEPVGYEEQPWFLNLVCRGRTGLDAPALLSQVKEIESQMGRTEIFRNGPRLIDIDILLFGQQVIAGDDLIVPHPRLTERGFVMIPLHQIAPELVHPQNGKTMRELLSELGSSKQVREWGHVPGIGPAAL